ncbi:MAG: hypothetical protein IPI46_00175 [Bacteroidetes bacterium]|nr:hypothetical protein [Bacteroidota bacterium]
MATILQYKRQLVGLLVGGLLGYIYYAQIGCASGTCSITSSPINSTLYGAIMGMLLMGIFEPSKKKENKI